MSGTICPWWLGDMLAHPLTRRIHDPAGILVPSSRTRAAVMRKDR